MRRDARARVSVVVPAFQAEAYLHATIESILGQTYPVLECVVVDDGSSDRTALIAEQFGPPVRVVRQANAGVSAARNRGVSEAAGDVIAFCDADDLWLPRKLELQLGALGDVSAGICLCGVQLMSEPQAPQAIAGPRFDRISHTDLWWHRDGSVPVALPSTLVAGRRLLDRIGPWDTALSTLADWDFAIRARRVHPFVGPAEPLVLYRRPPTAMSRNVDLLAADTVRLFAKLAPDIEPRSHPEFLRAQAWNWTVVAASYLHAGHPLRAVRWLTEAALSHPLAFAAATAARFGSR